VKETARRYYSSWVLLAVLLPMLIFSSLHVHPASHTGGDHCEECVHHLPHAGHISSQTFCSFDCVLCQFLTMPFLVAAAVVFVPRVLFYVAPYGSETQRVVSRTRGFVCLRAPPARVVCQ